MTSFIYLFIFGLTCLLFYHFLGQNKEGLENNCKKKACETSATHKNTLNINYTKQKIEDVKKEIEKMIKNASKLVKEKSNQINENIKNITTNSNNEKKMRNAIKK
tara:strand:+ start:467 stop:781 length:315 start_codon:yes stop_codon:yes gene_type:complete